MIAALGFLILGLIMGVRMIQDGADSENPGLGFTGMLVAVFSGGALLLLLFLWAIGVR